MKFVADKPSFVKGSSIASSVYSLAGIFDAVQVFALILSTVGESSSSKCAGRRVLRVISCSTTRW